MPEQECFQTVFALCSIMKDRVLVNGRVFNRSVPSENGTRLILSTQETEITDLPGLHHEFQASCSCVVGPCKTQKQT